MPGNAPLRQLLTGRPGLLAVAGVLAIGLLLVGWLDQRATRRELLGTLRTHADGLRETIGAAARANTAASRLAEQQMAERVRDNARMLAALDRERPLDAARIEAIARDNALFRVALFDADGSRGPSVGPGGYGSGGGPGGGQGSGPGMQQLVRRVLDGETEVVGELHAARRAGAARMAAAVARPRGGVILVNADASAVLELQQQSSLDTLLTDIVEHAGGVAYVVVQGQPTTRWAGALPEDLRTSAAEGSTPPFPAAPASREVTVDGRPVMEFAGPLGPDAALGTVRLGMRLDELRAAERRFLLRQATSLATALMLGAIALAYAWVRQRYGTLSAEHAKAQEALKRRDRLAAMGELASTVAHEIRNPLNAIAMSAQRLKSESFGSADDDEGRALVDVIQRESNRIDNRVQQFLAFARPPALVLADASMAALVEEVGEALRPTAALREVTLTLDTAHASRASVDVEQLRQVLDNLVRNAIEATAPGGRVELRAEASSGGHVITVRDTGVGIPPEDLPRIFDLYFTTKANGTGVGLAVSQQIVTAHGGRLDVDSVPSQGTVFTLLLPRHTP